MTVFQDMAKTGGADEIEIRFARNDGEFAEAARYMRRAAKACHDRVRSAEAGAILARISAGGSGPATGGLFLARVKDRLVGFALLGRAPNQALDMVWLHVGDACKDRVAAALRTEVSRLEAEWDVTVPRRAARVAWPAASRFRNANA